MDERRLTRILLETSAELIWAMDPAGRWTFLNAPGARRIYAREAAEMLGRPFVEVVAPELRERDYAVFRRVLEGQAVADFETRHLRSDGEPVDLAFNAVPLRDADGMPIGCAGTARDIGERVRAAAALHDTVAQLRLAVEAADLRQWEVAAGGEDAASGHDVHPDDRAQYLALLQSALASGEPFELEHRGVPAEGDGETRWLSSRGRPVFDASGQPIRMIGVAQDITARKAREEAARFLAYHDSLTGLPNRRLFDDRLAQALHLAQRRDRRLAVLLVDLDGFRQVNETLGHRGGDLVLKVVARRLGACLRKSDTLARQGGDEFVMLLADVQDEAACALVAGRVLEALGEAVAVEGRTVGLSACIGASLYPSDAGDGDALLRNADAALYRAKQKGRNQHEFFSR